MEKETKRKNHTPSGKELIDQVVRKMVELGLWKIELTEDIPTCWDSYNNFVIFNNRFFANPIWNKAGIPLWECISDLYSGKAIALQGKIKNDDFRSPSTKILYGNSSWAEYLDNGIMYTWNTMFTMFCTGNIRERHRVAKLNCEGMVVVDMFAGIGYFTLPYLVHAKAKQVIACEWNSASVEALKFNLKKNKVTKRCCVLEGDVRLKCPRGVADRINLGLIPSCENYWLTAAEILKPSGGILHVHGNVSSFRAQCIFEVECVECLALLNALGVDFANIPSKVYVHMFKIIKTSEELALETLDIDCLKWKKFEWFVWGVHVCHVFGECLYIITKAKWTVKPQSVNKVKDYAPHIDHLVLDVLCERETYGPS